MKKVLFGFVSLLIFLFVGVGNVSANNESKVFHGKAYLDVPLVGWESLDQVKNDNAKLKISNMTLNNDDISIKGVLTTNRGIEEEINATGKIRKSKMDPNNLVFKFNGSENDFSIANAEVESSPKEKELAVNKGIKGETVLSFTMFDRTKNNMYIFEQPIPKSILKEIISNVNIEELERAKTDTWAYKYFEGTVKGQKANIISLPSEGSESTVSLSSKSGENMVSTLSKSSGNTISLLGGGNEYATVQVEYDYGYGSSYHSTTAMLAFNGADKLYGQGEFQSSLTLSQYNTSAGTGETETGWSNVTIGNEEPVQVEFATNHNGTWSTDKLTKIEWAGTWAKPFGVTPTVSAGFAFGPVSISESWSADASDMKSGDFENLVTDYLGDEIFATRMKMNDTYLNNENHKYYVNVQVQHRDLNGEKVIHTEWRLPFYDSFNAESLDTKVISESAYYQSQ